MFTVQNLLLYNISSVLSFTVSILPPFQPAYTVHFSHCCHLSFLLPSPLSPLPSPPLGSTVTVTKLKCGSVRSMQWLPALTPDKTWSAWR